MHKVMQKWFQQLYKIVNSNTAVHCIHTAGGQVSAGCSTAGTGGSTLRAGCPGAGRGRAGATMTRAATATARRTAWRSSGPGWPL